MIEIIIGTTPEILDPEKFGLQKCYENKYHNWKDILMEVTDSGKNLIVRTSGDGVLRERYKVIETDDSLTLRVTQMDRKNLVIPKSEKLKKYAPFFLMVEKITLDGCMCYRENPYKDLEFMTEYKGPSFEK